MSIPVFTVEIAFGSKWADAAYVWTDVSDIVGRIGYTRGRQQELDRIEAGTGDSDLLDDTSAFSPRNVSSPYYPNVKVLVPIRQTATIAGTTYPCSQQFVEEWPRTRQAAFAERNVTTVDAFDFFAVAGAAGFSRPSELSGTRINAALDYLGWAAGRRVISAGRSMVPAVTFAADDTTKMLQHLQDIADAELGMFFMDAAGDAMFLDRGDMLGAPYNVSQATFSDLPVAGEFMYTDSRPNEGKDLIFNQWTGTRDGGTPQSWSDSTSIDEYGPRSKQETPLLTSDTEVLHREQFRLSQYKEPLERIESITVTPGEDTAAWQAVLSLDIGSRITVKEHQPGAGLVVDDYTIQNINFPRDGGSDAGVAITYQLWPADVNAWMVLDDPTFGILDANKLGY